MYSVQKTITKKRFDIGLFKLNIVRTDIILIINYAWSRSFNNINTNKKAIRDRGWGPLNKILLWYPEIACSKPSPGIQETQDNLANNKDINIQDSSPSFSKDTAPKVEIGYIYFNFNPGYAGEVIQTILKKAQRDEQTLRNIEGSKLNGISFCKSIEKVKKWSAGVKLFKWKVLLGQGCVINCN